LNRTWTFKKEAKDTKIGTSIIKDHATRFAGVIINYACLFIFTEILNTFYITSMAIGIVIATIWNFTGNTLWVWKSGK
jgi:putative flippase GtrA